jgi:hypothetical protein
MILPAIFLCAVQLQTGPDIPPGLNEAFITTCYSVEANLADSKFAKAKAIAALLPKNGASIGWNSKGVPAAEQADFRNALGKVIEESKPMINLVVAHGEAPDIAISFVPHIEGNGEGSLPPGARFEFHRDAPRLTIEISLTRTAPPKNITINDVHNEIAYGVAQYVGIERIPRFGSYASRTDQSTIESVALDDSESKLGQVSLEVSQKLREMANSQTRIRAAAPSIVTSEASIEGVKGIQDEPLQVSVKVTNKGTADLSLYALPDCSCLRPYVPPTIKPGETKDLVAGVNTALYTGHLTHSVLLYSNDPLRPVVSIPVHMDIQPLYRFVRSGNEAVPLTNKGANFTAYLVLAEPIKFSIITASILGMPGTVRYEPWHGVVPDDEESAGQVQDGFRFEVHMESGKYYGQYPASLLIGTDSDAFRELTYGFQVQKGVVVMPAQYNFGSVPPQPMTFSVIVSNPNKGFHITSMNAGSPYLSAKAVALKGDREYRIDVDFDGRSGIGDFAATMTIHTDDPNQPILKVPVMGQVQ